MPLPKTNPDADDRYKNEEWLRFQFYERGLKTNEIADLTGVTTGTISQWRKENFGFPHPHNNAEYLNRLHNDAELTVYEIADHLNMSPDTIRKKLKEFGLYGPDWSEWTVYQWTRINMSTVNDWFRNQTEVIVFHVNPDELDDGEQPTPDDGDVIHDDILDEEIVGSLAYNANETMYVAVPDDE